jgi:tRNA 2-selenouridine synthase SelU
MTKTHLNETKEKSGVLVFLLVERTNSGRNRKTQVNPNAIHRETLGSSLV